MRSVSATATQIINSPVRGVRWVADLYFNGERRAQDVPISDVSLEWDGDAQIAGRGSLTVVWSDPLGADLTPRGVSDWFAPFGSELQVDVIVSAGRFEERIALGRFLIVSVPEAWTSLTPLGDRVVATASMFKLTLRDPMHRVGRSSFAFPESPRSSSAWQEAQYLTGMPVIRNLPDAPVPGGVIYEDDRLEALEAVFAALGAWPHVTPSGGLTARPFAWTSVVDEVTTDTTVTSELSSERVYNRVVVEGKGDGGSVVLAIADVRDGPLRAYNRDGSPAPYGTVPHFVQSDWITNAEQAKAYAEATLRQVSRPRGITRTFSEPFNPLREVGDVIRLNGETVRIKRLQLSEATLTVTVEVAS